MDILAAVSYSFTAIYGLDIRKAYPDTLIEWAAEPAVRFAAYMAIYGVSRVRPSAALAMLIAVMLIHFDYLALARNL
jgi:hypothetical protein